MGILDDFSKRRKIAQPQASDLLRSLESQKYVIVTGQNPQRTPERGPFDEATSEKPDSQKNQEAIKAMANELDDLGLLYTLQEAHSDDPEQSLIVWHDSKRMDEDDFWMAMHGLAEEYGQQSYVAAEPDVKMLVQTDDENSESDDRFDENRTYDKDAGKVILRWTFAPKSWDELSSDQKATVEKHSQIKRHAGVLQGKKHRSDR
jgi:hypothetical protein